MAPKSMISCNAATYIYKCMLEQSLYLSNLSCWHLTVLNVSRSPLDAIVTSNFSKVGWGVPVHDRGSFKDLVPGDRARPL